MDKLTFPRRDKCELTGANMPLLKLCLVEFKQRKLSPPPHRVPGKRKINNPAGDVANFGGVSEFNKFVLVNSGLTG